jgi:hypothetical protein
MGCNLVTPYRCGNRANCLVHPAPEILSRATPAFEGPASPGGAESARRPQRTRCLRRVRLDHRVRDAAWGGSGVKAVKTGRTYTGVAARLARPQADPNSRNRLPPSVWLRRSGAGRLLIARCQVTNALTLPRPAHSREWLNVAIFESARCLQERERASPVQRHRADCSATLRRRRSQEAMARRRRPRQ